MFGLRSELRGEIKMGQVVLRNHRVTPDVTESKKQNQ